MTNDVTDSMLDEAPGCFALTASDGYLLSSSGGEISLFNIRSFEVITFDAMLMNGCGLQWKFLLIFSCQFFFVKDDKISDKFL